MTTIPNTTKNLDVTLCGHILAYLKELPNNCIDCVITSPPYWGLRDYHSKPIVWGGDSACQHEWIQHVRRPGGGCGSKSVNVGSNRFDDANMRDHDVISDSCAKCGAWQGQLGLEPHFDLYIEHLLTIFNEIKRVLKPTGTCWVNLGDTYWGGGHGGNTLYDKNGQLVKSKKYGQGSNEVPLIKWTGDFPKKSLCMIPTRFAEAMIDKSKWILRNTIVWHKPNCMPQSVRDRFTVDFEYVFLFTKSKKYYFQQLFEPYTAPMNRWGGQKLKASGSSIWDEGTGQQSYRDRDMRPNPKGRNRRCVWAINTRSLKEAHFATFPEQLVQPMIEAGCPQSGIVLDPFCGAGTVCLVAKKLGKHYIGIDINPEYVAIAEKRINSTKVEPATTEEAKQLDMFPKDHSGIPSEPPKDERGGVSVASEPSMGGENTPRTEGD